VSRETLSFVVVGHVDHGKSTLIGRLLYDTNSVAEEKMDEIRRVCGDAGDEVEFAFLLDHLEEERTQRITIDTAQVFFKTFKRDYVIIDAPGHREFLKNMITGASQAEAALLLVDAAEGVRDQTYRHAHMLSLLGISQIVVVVNKMDLVEFARERYDALAGEAAELLARAGSRFVAAIPVSARLGENVAMRSEKMPWYEGPTILEALDRLSAAAPDEELPLRFPVQDIFDLDGRLFVLGRIISGTLDVGQEICFQPSGIRARVEAVKLYRETRRSACAGESIAVALSGDELPVRGDIGCIADRPPAARTELTATVFWMDPTPLKTDSTLEIRLATQELSCKVARIADVVDAASLADVRQQADELPEAHIGSVTVKTERALCVDPYEFIPETGRCVLSVDGRIAGGGIIKEGRT